MKLSFLLHDAPGSPTSWRDRLVPLLEAKKFDVATAKPTLQSKQDILLCHRYLMTPELEKVLIDLAKSDKLVIVYTNGASGASSSGVYQVHLDTLEQTIRSARSDWKREDFQAALESAPTGRYLAALAVLTQCAVMPFADSGVQQRQKLWRSDGSLWKTALAGAPVDEMVKWARRVRAGHVETLLHWANSAGASGSQPDFAEAFAELSEFS